MFIYSSEMMNGEFYVYFLFLIKIGVINNEMIVVIRRIVFV